jgi:hypothetical protein
MSANHSCSIVNEAISLKQVGINWSFYLLFSRKRGLIIKTSGNSDQKGDKGIKRASCSPVIITKYKEKQETVSEKFKLQEKSQDTQLF